MEHTPSRAVGWRLADDVADEFSRLRAVNAKLLAALGHTRDILHGSACQEEADCVEACESARAAIKAAKGDA
jgi:hypothetical protein